jgi:hypothetical protein
MINDIVLDHGFGHFAVGNAYPTNYEPLHICVFL